MENNLVQFAERFLMLEKDKTPMVVVTLTDIKGSAPQNIGAKMIVGKDGILFGTIGGGKVESECLKIAKEYLDCEKQVLPHSKKWNLQKDIGMTCGGEVNFLFEVYNPQVQWNITVFGAGHVSQALIRLLLTLNCNITVIDERQEWLDKLPKKKQLTIINSNKMSEEVDKIHDNSFVIIVTTGHKCDALILYEALQKKNFLYLGVIGSKSKRNRMEQELKEMGIGRVGPESFLCPIGEKFGNNSPAEIAMSICAQLLTYRDKLNDL